MVKASSCQSLCVQARYSVADCSGAVNPFTPRGRKPGASVSEQANGGIAEVKKASEYRQHAAECRVLARKAISPEERDQLLNMAATWEQLAIEREALITRNPALALEVETHRPVPTN